MEAVRKVFTSAVGRQFWTRRRWKIVGGTGGAFLLLLTCAVGCDFVRWRKTELLTAAIEGKPNSVLFLLKQGADPNDALGSAAKSGQIGILKLLIAHGAKVSGKAGTPALCRAIEGNQPAAVTFLLDQGAEINALDSYPWEMPPIAWASFTGSWPLFQTLIDRGARIDIRARDGSTALMRAASIDENDSLRICRYLIAHGANVNAVDQYGRTALIDVTYFGPRYGDGTDGSYPPERMKMLRFLLDSGANVNAQDNMGSTALRYAAEYRCANAKALLKKAGGTF